jgi:hypothetical protein
MSERFILSPAVTGKCFLFYTLGWPSPAPGPRMDEDDRIVTGGSSTARFRLYR